MQKNALVSLCITGVFGAFGAFFRWIQNLTAYEISTGLYSSGNIWGIAIIALGILFCTVQAVRSYMFRSEKLCLPNDTHEVYGAKNLVFRYTYRIFALLLAIGALIVLLTPQYGVFANSDRLLGILGLGAALGFFVLMYSADKRRTAGPDAFGCVLMVIFYGYWLVASYRENTATPTIWAYSAEIVALAASLLAVYYVAGVPFTKPAPYLTPFFTQLSALLCLVTLPDERAMGKQIMIMATASIMLLFSWQTISALRVRKDDEDNVEAPEAVHVPSVDPYMVWELEDEPEQSEEDAVLYDDDLFSEDDKPED